MGLPHFKKEIAKLMRMQDRSHFFLVNTEKHEVNAIESYKLGRGKVDQDFSDSDIIILDFAVKVTNEDSAQSINQSINVHLDRGGKLWPPPWTSTPVDFNNCGQQHG